MRGFASQQPGESKASDIPLNDPEMRPVTCLRGIPLQRSCVTQIDAMQKDGKAHAKRILSCPRHHA